MKKLISYRHADHALQTAAQSIVAMSEGTGRVSLSSVQDPTLREVASRIGKAARGTYDAKDAVLRRVSEGASRAGLRFRIARGPVRSLIGRRVPAEMESVGVEDFLRACEAAQQTFAQHAGGADGARLFHSELHGSTSEVAKLMAQWALQQPAPEPTAEEQVRADRVQRGIARAVQGLAAHVVHRADAPGVDLIRFDDVKDSALYAWAFRKAALDAVREANHGGADHGYTVARFIDHGLAVSHVVRALESAPMARSLEISRNWEERKAALQLLEALGT